MLTEKNKQHFKKWLSQRLNESLEKAQDTLIDLRALKDKLSNHVDEASHASAMGFALRIRDMQAKLIIKIREALERLEDGTFGSCEECGEEIPLRRLRARPVTTLCIECKKEQEAEERTQAEEYPIAELLTVSWNNEERGFIMASNFRILVHQDGDSLHLTLSGDFDGSSACELLETRKENAAGVRRVFICTCSL